MELLQLKYLCTAARFENFSRAAKFHNIPQSAISKTIAQLERELGTQLFVRNGNRVALNEKGKHFCREANRALSILNDAAADVRERETLRGEVRLLVEEHDSAVRHLVATYRKEYPDVLLSVCTQEKEGFDYDLRVCAKHILPERTAGERLRDARVELLLPASHRLSGEMRISLSDLRGEKQILLTGKGAWEESLRRAGFDLPVALQCDDRAALYAYVGAGVGVAFLSGADRHMAEEAGAVIRPLQEDITYPTCLTFRRSLSPAATALHALLVAGLTSEAYTAKE